MVDKTTPRLGLPVPYLTNPLKIDVGKLTDALTMLDKNAVMLTDWDITSDSWQKMGKISNLAQGKIAITLMVVTGTGFANIVMQTGDGSVTTVGDPARITVTAQTNLGANSATILGGKLVEVAADTYEIWFNIAPSTAPRKWTGLLIAGNGATIDWTHSSGAQPTGGVALNIARSLTDQEIASQTITRDGAVLTAGYAGLMGIKLPYFDFAATGDTITSHVWRVGETMRVKAADATTANGFPATITGAGATAWRIHCEGINEDRTSTVFIFASEGATPTWVYRITRTTTNWSAPRRMYTSDNPPAASEVKAVAQMDGISTVINLNDRILPSHYGVVSLTSAAGAVADNNFPFDEPGQLTVFPFGASGGVTQVYIAKSGRIASRSYDGSVFTDWRRNAMAGANDDITSMTALSGPLKLGGDAVNDYDAVTLRQLKSTAGGSGPTINGVLNNFIGSVDWFMGTRAKLPAGYLAADGQLLKRTDYPDIWAGIQSGLLKSVADTAWVSGIGGRANFSYGDGDATTGTTFRLPDLNGIRKPGDGQLAAGAMASVQGLFLRGDGSTDAGEAGSVRNNAAPNIIGSINFHGSGPDDGTSGTVFAGSSGAAFTSTGPMSKYVRGSSLLSSATSFGGVVFDSSKAHPAYGRNDGPGPTTEVRPNSAVGIWIIRVGGSFQAANTTFEVITGDTVVPSNNTVVYGGAIKSVYQVAGKENMRAQLVARKSIGGVGQINLSFTDSSSGTPIDTVFRFNADGTDRTFSGGAFRALDLQYINANDANGNIIIQAPRDYRSITSYDLPAVYPLGVTGGIQKGDSFPGAGWPSGDIVGLIHNRGWADQSGHSTSFQIGYHGQSLRIGYRGATYNSQASNWYLGPFYEFRTARNTTVDGNGFVKTASPIVDIFGDGKYVANDEAIGVTVTRKAEGEYLIMGCKGLHSDAGWGGKDGGFSIPKDRNDQPLIWLDYEVNADGSILVKTYHRTHMDAPEFARNVIAGKNDGDSIDIPKGLFIQARVNMP